jgi:hypothetical protein
MTLLRILILVIALYYGLKLAARWIFRSDSQRTRARRDGKRAGGERRYSDLTDQEIEDAEYEEIEPGGK